MTTDNRAEEAYIQKKIQDALGLGADRLIFEFSRQNSNVRLDLITINPRHNQSFLYHRCEGIDKLDTLRKMLEYVKKEAPGENSYTVQWSARGDKELHTSYFRARNIHEALDKLYYGRDMNTLTVYSVTLNPLS